MQPSIRSGNGAPAPGCGRADDLRDAVDNTEGWVRDRAGDVIEGVSDVAGQVGDVAGDVRAAVEDTAADRPHSADISATFNQMQVDIRKAVTTVVPAVS